MDLETFQSLPTDQIARLVHEFGPKVCAFPINGTRRWFLIEHPTSQDEDFLSAYLELTIRRHIELYQLLFDHGLDTLLTPIFGPDIMDRGQDYLEMATEGLRRLATYPAFLEFYETCDVRVRFYGDYHKHLASTPYAYLLDSFKETTERTLTHNRHRLFFGLFAHDATETVGELAIDYYARHGRAPDRRTLVELYYGEPVEPMDLFIGFDKFCAFDMPLLATGNEDLYFTVAPSPYLTARQLRDILYDHLYARRGKEPDYGTMSAKDQTLMREFYRANREHTLGIGKRHQQADFWYPLPQVELPDNF